MRIFSILTLTIVLAVGTACSSSGGDGGGGSVSSDAALKGMMNAIALDLAAVLGEIAPVYGAAAEKQDGGNTTACPDGGSATWMESSPPGSGGNLDLEGCVIRGLNLNGQMAGFLEQQSGFVDATMLRSLGPLEISGAYSGMLNVQRLDISSNLPPTDELTYWFIQATSEDGEPLCAWSGSNSCEDIQEPF